MQINTITTFTDWAWINGTAGKLGVARIFDFLAIARVKKLYWRVFNGGLAIYPSRVAPVFRGAELGNSYEIGEAETKQYTLGEGGGSESRGYLKWLDAEAFDSFEMAVEVGREFGIDVYAWFTFYEEDHGGDLLSPIGSDPRFQGTDIDGLTYSGTIDFFYDEVQDYKLAIVAELLERGVDGIMLDYVRHNATPSGDPDGIHRFGYNADIREAFKAEDGRDPVDIPRDDPAWLAFKCEYQARFLRRIREQVGPDKGIDMMVPMPFDLKRWLCLDLAALSKDKVVDLVVPQSLPYCCNPEYVSHEYKMLAAQVGGGHTRAGAAISTYYDLVDTEVLEASALAAAEAGAEELILYEADALHRYKHGTSIRALNLGEARATREVRVKRVERTPADADWDAAHWQDRPFFIGRHKDALHGEQRTEFAMLAGPDALHARLLAHGEQADYDREFYLAHKVFIDILGARFYWLMKDRCHLFLDPGSTRRTYTHYILDRDGETMQETREDNSWTGNWTGAATTPSAILWQADWTIPYATLGVDAPEAGERWGFTVAREHAATREAAQWFVTLAPEVDPREWGDLVFE